MILAEVPGIIGSGIAITFIFSTTGTKRIYSDIHAASSIITYKL